MTDLFGAYQSQSTRQLARIDSSKYPDTNKDFEANMRRVNGFVDYIASYLQQMQKGVDKANQDPITRLRDFGTNLGVLLGGGELLYGINMGDLQYFLPALGAIFGFDSNTPFPLNLFYAVEHLFLGYIIPLDSWNIAIEDIIDGWMTALGLNPTFIAAVHLVLDNLARATGALMKIFNDATNLLGVFNIFNFTAGPVGPIWSTLSDLLSNFNAANLGAITDPFLETLTPWISALGSIIGTVDDFLEAFDGGLAGLDNISAWLTDLLNMFGGFIGLGTGTTTIFDPYNIPLLGPILRGLFGGFTGTIAPTSTSFSDVGGAAAANTDVLGSISAAVARLEASFADLDPTTILVEDPFEYTNTTGPDSANWDMYDFICTSVGYGHTADGHVEADGHQIIWGESGDGNHGKRFMFKGTDAMSTHDDMTVKYIIGSNAMPTSAGSFTGIIARAKVDMSEFLELRIYENVARLWWCTSATGSVGGGTETQIGGDQALGGNPGVGSIISIKCGTTSGHRYFDIVVNSQNFTIFDGSSITSFDSSHRWRGFTMFSGQVVFFGITSQKPTAPITHWASQNAA